MITKKELLQMLSDTESYNIERTESTGNMDKFCQAICAFSNDMSGSGKNGYLIIGVKDNGELSGLQVDDKLLLQIANIRTDGNILPQPTMTVEKFHFDEGDVLVAEVQPSEFPPARYRGRVWVRVGPRKSTATEAEEKILSERRLSNVHTFDAMPCLGTSIDDLDVVLIRKEFLPRLWQSMFSMKTNVILQINSPLLAYMICAITVRLMGLLSCSKRILSDTYMGRIFNMFASRIRIVRVIFLMNISLAVIFVRYCLRLMLLSRQVFHKNAPFP